MYINFKFLLSVLSAVLLLGLVMPVFCFEPSGGVLVLDGEDDYAILPLAEHGYIIPRNTEEFTVEVWFYPKTRPKEGEKDIILSQQVAFGLISHDCRGRIRGKNQVCAYGTVYLEGAAAHGITGIDVVIEKDQWNYMAVIFKDSTFHLAYNNQIIRGQKKDFLNVIAGELRVRDELKDFVVGGYLIREARFHGAIDAIRFSDIARYDLPAELGILPFDPPHRFLKDKHTLALWNFNDEEGVDRFKDASGNRKTLIGMNGAITSGPLAVNPTNTSITTTWGQIKSESF